MKKFKVKRLKPLQFAGRRLADMMWMGRECSVQCYQCDSGVYGVYGSPVVEWFIADHRGHKISIRDSSEIDE